MKALPRLELAWGLGFVVLSLAWMALERALGWHGPKIGQHPTLTLLFAPVAIAVYVFLLRAKRAALGGVMTWKQGFVAGMICTAVVTVLSPLTQVLVHRVITPDFFPNVQAHAVATGKMTAEEAAAYFTLANYQVQAAIGALVMGALTSAIVALVLRRKAA